MTRNRNKNRNKRKLTSKNNENDNEKNNNENPKRQDNNNDAKKFKKATDESDIVICKEFQSKKSLSLATDFEEFIDPITKETFFQSYFRQCAVHIRNFNQQQQQQQQGRVGELQSEMHDLNVKTLLEETSSENIFIWLQQQHNGFNGISQKKNNSNNNNTSTSSPLIQSIEVSDPNTAHTLHEVGGHAVYCRAPPKVEQCLVSTFLKGTGLGCGQYDPSGESQICMGRGEVETFIAATAGHVTNWHYDFQENFTIQLSGTKQWTLKKGTIQDPIRGCTPHYAAPEAVESQLKASHLYQRNFQFGHPKLENCNVQSDKEQIVTVCPGDILYFPAGMWHKVEVIEPGISINVSLMAANYATLTCQALHHLLFEDAKWRQPIQNNTSHDPIRYLTNLLQQDLPEKIKRLKQGQIILPPHLQYPPAFQIHVNDSDNEESNGEEADYNEIMAPAQESASSSSSSGDDNGENDNTAMEEDTSNINNNNDDDDDDEHLNVTLDPLTFDGYPQGWEFQMDRNKSIIRNPLAHLLCKDEITNFYHCSSSNSKNKGSKSLTTSRNNDKNTLLVFVLNFNYAGNEMHESAIRVEFVDKTGFAKKLCQLEQENHQGAIPVHLDNNKNCEDNNYNIELLIRFLVYHGYLLH